MFTTLPPSALELAERVATGPDIITVQLDDTEFAAYVCALRDFWRKATDGRAPDYEIRMQALDVLFGIKAYLYADSVDTGHLRACWQSRHVLAGEASDETYGVGLTGPAGRSVVLGLVEYARSQPEDGEGGAFRVAAQRVLDRIEGPSR